MRHRKYIGRTGSGKTNAAAGDLVEQFENGDRYITAAFPHPQAGIAFCSELYARYGDAVLPRLVIERIADMDSVIMRRTIKCLQHDDYFIRQQANDELLGAAIDIITRRRGLDDLATYPVLEKYSRLAIRLAQNQPDWFPEHWLPYALRAKHHIKKHLQNLCTDPELRREFEILDSYCLKDQMALLQPVERMLQGFFQSPVIMARTTKRPTWDKRAFFENSGCYVILGGGVSVDATRNFICSDFQETAFMARQGMNREGIYFRDESNNFHLLGAFESHCFSTLRAFKLFLWDVVQSLDYPTEEIRFNIMQNTDHYWFQQGSWYMANECAHDLLGMIDSMKVHHTEERVRQVHLNPSYEERRSVTRNEHGKMTESITHIPVNRFGEVSEKRDVYLQGSEQLLYNAKDSQRWQIGTCMVRPMEGVPYQHNYPLFRDSWAFKGLQEAMFWELMQKMKQKSIFEKPELTMPEPPTPPTTNFQKRGTRKLKGS